MGMFNSIIADLRCPTNQEVGKDTEIQIKWQDRRTLGLTAYRLGDVLEDIDAEYDNTWIETDYFCHVCSKHTTGKNGVKYIKMDDQQIHPIFVCIHQGKICEIVSEQEFAKTGVTDFIRY